MGQICRPIAKKSCRYQFSSYIYHKCKYMFKTTGYNILLKILSKIWKLDWVQLTKDGGGPKKVHKKTNVQLVPSILLWQHAFFCQIIFHIIFKHLFTIPQDHFFQSCILIDFFQFNNFYSISFFLTYIIGPGHIGPILYDFFLDTRNTTKNLNMYKWSLYDIFSVLPPIPQLLLEFRGSNGHKHKIISEN